MNPPDDRNQTGRTTRHARQVLDALMYAVVWVITLVSVAAMVSFPLGGGWLGVKYILFFIGFLVFGISAIQLRPKPPWKHDDASSDSGEREETRFQTFVQRFPPLGRYGLDPDDRLPAPAKLFVASIFSLVLSYILEVGFDIKA